MKTIPMKLSKREVNAQFLMKFQKFLVRSKQKCWIRLILSCHLQYVRIIFFQIVTLLISMHGNGFKSTILSHSVERKSTFQKFIGKNLPFLLLIQKNSTYVYVRGTKLNSSPLHSSPVNRICAKLCRKKLNCVNQDLSEM